MLREQKSLPSLLMCNKFTFWYLCNPGKLYQYTDFFPDIYFIFSYLFVSLFLSVYSHSFIWSSLYYILSSLVTTSCFKKYFIYLFIYLFISLGRLWNAFSTRRYRLPVMDSIFVRKSQRGKGFGLQMLKDYVLSFKENSLGLRYPLPTSMYKGTQDHLADKSVFLFTKNSVLLFHRVINSTSL